MTPPLYCQHGTSFKFYDNGVEVLSLDGPEAAFEFARLAMNCYSEGLIAQDEDGDEIDLPETRQECERLVLALMRFCVEHARLS